VLSDLTAFFFSLFYHEFLNVPSIDPTFPTPPCSLCSPPFRSCPPATYETTPPLIAGCAPIFEIDASSGIPQSFFLLVISGISNEGSPSCGGSLPSEQAPSSLQIQCPLVSEAPVLLCFSFLLKKSSNSWQLRFQLLSSSSDPVPSCLVSFFPLPASRSSSPGPRVGFVFAIVQNFFVSEHLRFVLQRFFLICISQLFRGK